VPITLFWTGQVTVLPAAQATVGTVFILVGEVALQLKTLLSAGFGMESFSTLPVATPSLTTTHRTTTMESSSSRPAATSSTTTSSTTPTTFIFLLQPTPGTPPKPPAPTSSAAPISAATSGQILLETASARAAMRMQMDSAIQTIRWHPGTWTICR